MSQIFISATQAQVTRYLSKIMRQRMLTPCALGAVWGGLSEYCRMLACYQAEQTPAVAGPAPQELVTVSTIMCTTRKQRLTPWQHRIAAEQKEGTQAA